MRALNRAALVFFIVTLLVDDVGAQCPLVKLDIFQNVTGKVAEEVNPVATAQTVGDFYDYRGGSCNAPLPMGGRRALLAIHQDTNTCDLGLVVTFSAPLAGDPFGAAVYYINGDVADPVVKDDPELTQLPLHDDSYDDMFDRRKGFTAAKWKWFTTDTDGMAIKIQDGWKGCIHIQPIWDVPAIYPNGPINYNSIDEWMFVGDGMSTTSLNKEEDVFICMNGGDMKRPNINPFPRTITGGNCDQLGTYQQPPCGMCERNLCHNHWICTVHQRLNCMFGMDYYLPPTFP